jgi:hypothetical protein
MIYLYKKLPHLYGYQVEIFVNVILVVMNSHFGKENITAEYVDEYFVLLVPEDGEVYLV